MKTTIDISDDLAERAKAFAARERITLRSLVERGLREILRLEEQREQFKLRDASVGGRGLQAEYQGADWSRIREVSYEGRGG